MISISKWSETFETSDTRKRQRLAWCFLPSGNDSTGYVELMSHGEKGVVAYGVFVAICQWSATCKKDVRGSLCKNDGTPLTVRQIAARVRMPLEIVSESVALLTDPEIGWLIEDSEKRATNLPPANTANSAAKPAFEDGGLEESASCLPMSADDLPGLCKDKDKEKDKEKKNTGAKIASKKFVRPTIEQVREYCQERNNGIDPEQFVDHYEANGWKRGNTSVKDWKACVRTWEKRRRDEQRPKAPRQDAAAGRHVRTEF